MNGQYEVAPETDEAVTGEVMQDEPPARPVPQIERAADGQVLAPPSNTTGTFLDLLEDGDFSRDAYLQLQELAEAIRLHGTNVGKAKGKAVITLNFEYEGEALRILGDVKVSKPELPRRKSIVWTDDCGDFCRFPPRQAQLFGGRAPRVVG